MTGFGIDGDAGSLLDSILDSIDSIYIEIYINRIHEPLSDETK